MLLLAAGLVGGWLITPSNTQLAEERRRVQQGQSRLQQDQQQLEVTRRQLAEERQRLAEERKQFETANPQEPARVAGNESPLAKPESQSPVPPPPPTTTAPAGKTWRSPTTDMDFVPIPAGAFKMGADSGDSDEKPVHEVRISKAFYLGKYEVTRKEWHGIMGTNPSNFKGDVNQPVERVSWEDVQSSSAG
jgi:formylglycine-generating enzyme required for sulfatase activity